MTSTGRSWRRRAAMAAALAFAGLAAGASPAAAEPKGELQNASVANGSLNLLFSAFDGTEPSEIDPASVQVKVTVDGQTRVLEPSVGTPEGRTKRTAVLVLDTSESMTPERLAAAKSAANTYLSTVPEDVEVGLVTFGDPARKLMDPTTDHDAIMARINGLGVKGDTAMYGAVLEAAKMLTGATDRSIVLLTDGERTDDEKVKLSAVKDALAKPPISITGVVVGERKARPDVAALTGEDRVIVAEGAGLRSLVEDTFEAQGEAINQRVLVTAKLPDEWAAKAGNVTITAVADGAAVTATSLFVPKQQAAPKPTPAVAAPPIAEPDPRLTAVTTPVVVVAIIGLFGALVILVSSAAGALVHSPDEESEVVRRLSVYTFSGREARRAAVAEQTTALGNSAFARGAVELADRLARGRNLERTLDGRLDAAGLPLRTAEWTVLHTVAAVGTTLVFLLISAGSILAGLLGLVLGLAGPWAFLVIRQSRRESAFLAQLPDTLQLLAGSLSAGYSLPQAMDTVVREARPPIGTEFNRALIEARLGVPPEDALDGIAARTRSRDFSWIVMAIRIQRDVGGNLAELLSSVAETLRERERLRRQVSALSAEGRLSGVILAALPLIFAVYLMLVQPDYLEPMFSTPLGLLLLITGIILLLIGGLWMSRVVRVRV